jgi:hypothetical protein
MTVLLVCAEDCDVETFTGTVGWSTTAGDYHSYMRGAFTLGSWDNTDPPTPRFRSKAFTSAQSEFWTSFYFKAGNTLSVANSMWVRFLDTSGVCRLLIRGASDTRNVKLCTRTAAGTITDLVTSTGFSPSTTLLKFDVYIKYANDGTGRFELYQDGSLIVSYSGANTTDGATQLGGGVEWATWTNGGSSKVSGAFVDTTDTRGKRPTILNSTTAGNAQQWTGTASNVNQNAITNDSQYILSDTANQVQQYKPAALPAGDWAVDAVVMSARAIRGAGGPQNIQFATRIATTDYFSSNVQPDTSFSGKQNIQTTNPATASAWTEADLADTNFQYGVKSIT